jgi:hypothetical protein
MFRRESARCGCWLRALAGTCVAAGLAAVGAQLPPAGASAAQPRADGFGPSAGVALVSAVSLAAAQPNYATLTLMPTSVTAGVITQFSLTFAALMPFKGGTVAVQVPAGWAAPTHTGSAGSPGFTSVTWTGPGPPTVTLSTTTITITDIALGTDQVVTVSYWAAALQPASSPSETVSFAATAQQFASSAMQSLTGQVTVMSPVSSSTSPASSSTSPVSSSSSSRTGRGGSGSHVPVGLVLGVAAAVGAVMLLAWRLVRHRPVPLTAQTVRAMPNAGPPAHLAVHTTGTEPTLTVRIEPHPDAGTTSIEELWP